jgi:hypothetical protein
MWLSRSGAGWHPAADCNRPLGAFAAPQSRPINNPMPLVFRHPKYTRRKLAVHAGELHGRHGGFYSNLPSVPPERSSHRRSTAAGVSQVAKNEWYWIVNRPACGAAKAPRGRLPIGRRIPSRPTSARSNSSTSGDRSLDAAAWQPAPLHTPMSSRQSSGLAAMKSAMSWMHSLS